MLVWLLLLLLLVTNAPMVMACNPSSDDQDDWQRPPGWTGTYLHGGDKIDEAHLDVENSGRLQRSIHKFHQHPSSQSIFKVMDNNGDENIDACEWMEAGMTTNVREYVNLLDRVDKNGDNVLSQQEFNDIHVRWRYGEMKDEDKK